MNKMNNKGFAVSTILYGILALTILILMLIFGVMKASKDMNQDLSESIEEKVNKCASLEVILENCYYEGSSCLNEKYEYDVCTEKTTTLHDKILNDNVSYQDNASSKYVTSNSGIDFSKISSDTNGKGLYYTSTNTEKNETTYYFRGDVKNNYVSFANILWRIIRINEDGSVRIITEDTVASHPFQNSSADNAHAGYMYGTIASNTVALTHANVNSSSIKTYLENWYDTNLANYTSYIVDPGFCNDRKISTGMGYWATETMYSGGTRLYNKRVQFKCEQADDLFTIGTTINSKGNSKLTKPIGLITYDEASYAGAVYNVHNGSIYLNNNNNFWTMTPSDYDTDFAALYMINYWSGSGMHGLQPSIESGVRPVINLKSTVQVITGNGTRSNPYTIMTI